MLFIFPGSVFWNVINSTIPFLPVNYTIFFPVVIHREIMPEKEHGTEGEMRILRWSDSVRKSGKYF